MTESHRQVLLALAGDEQVLASLPPGSALLRHLPLAQAALEAFCRGDDAAMQAALSRLPFRSPYRDLRWLLKGLASHPGDPAGGRRFLARIVPDSPFHLPARIAEAVLSGEAPSASPPVRAFAAAFRQPARSDGQAEASTGKVPLPEVEKSRIQALHEERHGDRRRAYELWCGLLADYRRHEPMKAAAVARHLADLAADLYGAEDPRVGRWLDQAKALDPDDRAVWLRLAAHYRRRGKAAKLGKTLAEALARFPEDGELLWAAARAALERGACRKAAGYAGRLLCQDPIHHEARTILFRARTLQARKHIAAQRGDLALRALAEAGSVAGSDRDRAQVLVLQGWAARAGGDDSQAESWFRQARRLLHPPQADWLITAEALLTRQPAPLARSLLQQLRLVLNHASLGPDKSTMTALLGDAVALAEIDADAVRSLLGAGSRYFRRLASLEWSLEEIGVVGESLLALECFQWLRDLVRSHPRWRQEPPLLVYLDIAAKCRGVAENLTFRDADRLWRALERIGEDRHGIRGRIERLLEDRQEAFSLRSPPESGETVQAEGPDWNGLLQRRMEAAAKTVTAWLDPRRWLS